MELPHLLGHAVHAFGFDDADGEAVETGDVFRAVTGSDPAPVFVEEVQNRVYLFDYYTVLSQDKLTL